ncbi:hypothetical protein TNCV_5081061 [Trichonephila clavipes]|nr:hypothetical protein TNCV_5081061 [Trichonephila clavipes]
MVEASGLQIVFYGTMELPKAYSGIPRAKRKIRKENYKHADRRTVLLVRWIVRSVSLEIVGSSGHEKVPTSGKPGLEQPGRPRGERIEGSCGKHLWIPQ